MFILKRLFQKLIKLLPLKSYGSLDQGKNFYLIQLKSYPLVHSLHGSVVKAQIIFLNRWLDCPEEKKREHDMIQVMINERKAEFNYETRDYNPYQRAISKQKSHNLWRQRMKIVAKDGRRVDLDLPEEDDTV
jgi:hypothetical protein